eukprot:gene3492-3989_t
MTTLISHLKAGEATEPSGIPSSYKYHRDIVVKVAVASRVFVYIYALCVTLFLGTFDSSASLNSVSPLAQLNQTAQHTALTTHESSGQWVEMLIHRVFVKWDSIYYTRIAEYGYEYEQYHAFFPLFPLTMRVLSLPLSLVLRVSTPDAIVLAGLIISNVSFVISSVQLFKLGIIIFNHQRLSFIAAILYCINPASIFMSAVYTESLYNLLVFSGLYYLYGGRFYLNSSRMLGLDAMPTRRYVVCSTLAALLFAGATFTRANGILLCGFIAYRHLATLLTPLFRRIFVLLNRITQARKSSPVLTHSTSFGHLANKALRPSITSVIMHSVLAALQMAVVVAPYIAFQYFGYSRYCLDAPATSKHGVWPRPWCAGSIPNLYGYVQNAYWNQGFFNYYTIQQIPNFLLAAPMTLLATCAVVSYIRYFTRHPYEMTSVAAKHRLKNKINLERSPYFSAHLVPFAVYLAFLIVFSTTFMHVQVITRFFCHSPVIFWFAAKPFVEPSSSPRVERQKHTILWYFLLYCIVGCVLFPNFYPWT